MQLRWKKFRILSTIFVYCITFVLQSNFALFQVWAQEKNIPRVNIVAVLVDDKIYDSISGWISSYTSYIQKNLSETKALVMPINLNNIDSYDIHRMMENIYFDWLKDINSSLIWLIMIWDIPLPVVNQNWYVFPTVYPYVDFENQKYIWDTEAKYFVSNNNPDWQAEIWHWLINYWDDTQAYLDFFSKIENYQKNPENFIGDSMWYEDFIADKEWFIGENFQYYKNKIMFGEDLWYQRYSPLMKNILWNESIENWTNILQELSEEAWIEIEWLNDDMIKTIKWEWSQDMHTTKMVQQEIKDGYLADYNDLFSKNLLSIKRENVFAWWRWIKEYENSDWEKSLISNIDSSSSMIQIKDSLYRWNENLEWVIQNLNDLMEDMIDKKIEKEKYSMDIVIPVEYKKVKWKRAYFKCFSFVSRWENYYFWKSARYIDDPKELSIYRWTYRNLATISWLDYASLLSWNNSIISNRDATNTRLKSIWASYDIFSNQVEWNRGYVMLKVEEDLNDYEENRTSNKQKTKCVQWLCTVRRKSWPENCKKGDGKCETLNDFAKRRWWWASAINLNTGSALQWRYELNGYKATDAWKPIFDMWGYQSLLSWNDEWFVWKGWVDWVWVGPQWAATSFQAYEKYASPTQVEWWNRSGFGFRIYENHIPNNHINFSEMDYWNLNSSMINSWTFSKESANVFNIEKVNKKKWRNCGWSEKYTYKFLSSVIKHDSTTDDEINGVDYDKYWKNWKIWRYYSDIKFAYESVYKDINDVINLSQSSLKWIRDNENILNDRIWPDLDDLIWQLLSWSYVTGFDSTDVENKISEILEEVYQINLKNKSDLFDDIYVSIWSLFTDNIVSSLEHIIYDEWWDPEDYTWSLYNLSKIKLLPSWIDEIKKLNTSILSRKNDVLKAYTDAISSLESQRNRWNKYSWKLLSLSEKNSDQISSIAEQFDNMFISSFSYNENEDDPDADPEDEGDNLSTNESIKSVEIILTWWTAEVEINDFVIWLNSVGKIFGNLVEEDDIWLAIINEAKKDSDFIKWALKKWTNIKKLSESELITEYAKWAKWDWVDSNWAKKNHDLLVWVTDHLSWMNILTPDRPIDSPRYVSMQSIAKNEIKLIYPNLFKVEVFKSAWKNKSWYDIHELMTREEIKQSLIKYLNWKVQEYNSILREEYDKSSDLNIYFQKISDFNSLATPTKDKNIRPYNYFTYDNFVESIWWEWMLDVIAEVLYYQNLTNKKKLSSSLIESDISLIRDSFNLNDKRANIMEDYLLYWNNKNPLLVLPNYKLEWYEVAYINSDWKDYIIPWDMVSNELSDSIREITNKSDTKLQISNEEQNLNDVCGIPMNWTLPVFKLEWWKPTSPWLEGFKCWWKETKKNPLKAKFTFSNGLWEILDWDWLSDKDWENTFSINRWDIRTENVDNFDELIEVQTEFDSTQNIINLEIDAEKHNQEVLSREDWVWNALSNFYRNVKISNSNSALSDNNSSSLLEISSAVDVWNITVNFMSTGDWCLKIDEQNICSEFSKTFNPKINPFSWIVTTADHVAWTNAIIIRISLWSEYIEKVIRYTISPSDLDNVEIKVWSDRSIAWMLTPVEFIWYDKYGNRVSRWLENYNFVVSQWRFLKEWSYQTWFATNDFRKLKIYYQAPSDAKDNNEAIIQIYKSSDSSENKKYLWTHVQKIIQATPEIKLNDKVIFEKNITKSDQLYRLWVDENIYFTWWNINISRLQKLDIDIKDAKWKLIDINSQILLASRNWLVVIWKIQKDANWKDIFVETSMSYISWWRATMYYYPTKTAWQDIVEIDIPWLESRVINLSILPGYVSDVQLKASEKSIQIWNKSDLEIFVYDKWWNLINDSATINITYDEDKISFIPEIWKNWSATILVDSWYKKLEFIWTWAWFSYVLWSSGWVAEIAVDKHIFPETWLNIMYLNYFWNDRWNQWWYFSENNKYIETLMKKSKKVIATTTQLVSEEKIKRMLWKIEPWFRILNSNNLDTFMIVKWNKFNISLWWIANMEWWIPALSWLQVPQDTIKTILNNSKTATKDYAFFVPNGENYSIKNWILYDGSEKIANILEWEISLQLTRYYIDNWDNIWNITHKGINYGSIIFHIPGFMPWNSSLKSLSQRYIVSSTFTNWSTKNLSSIWIFDDQSNFELDSWYKSIQDSKNIEEKIWFLWDFKNITLFAQWEIVWEATRKFWSEFVINLWDPVLSKKSKNKNVYGTKFDGWVWKEIYVDSENDIFGTYYIDFNKDWLEDLLVVYLDWSIKLAKNYGWNPDLRNMQDLMRIAIDIKEVFVWDVDGNWYDDIIVHTQNNQIRVYLNKNWVFDVDGNVACLNLNVYDWEISSDPMDISEIFNLFVEDMDLDWISDIITYDHKWYVKIFYGWSTKWYANYLSKEKYTCDEWWYDREIENTQIVTALWVQIANWEEIYDNSMLRWVWLEKKEINISGSKLSDFWITFDPESLSSLIKGKTQNELGSIKDAVYEVIDNFDVNKASQKFVEESLKYQDISLYENKLVWWNEWNNYVFVPISYLDQNNSEDVAVVWKTYSSKKWWILTKWDKVTVTVNILAKRSFIWSFWDIIQWPRSIRYDEKNIFTWINFIQNQKNAEVKKRDGGFAYLIDNISLNPWEKLVYQYDLEYSDLALKNMYITYDTFWSNDKYPDIKLQSSDGCIKDFDAYINQWKRSFSKNVIKLQSMIEDEYKKSESNSEDFGEKVVNVWSDIQQLPGIVWDKINRIKLLNRSNIEISNDETGRKELKNVLLKKIEEGWFESLNMNLNVNLSIFEEQTEYIENVIDDIMRWMCNGFSFWWSSNCKWLPVPFNQAFLAPWKYHMFGCWNIPMWQLENWLPAFFFPWTLHTPFWPFPIPRWQKSVSDSFVWPWWWIYPSWIRIYAAPTLTAQLWVAVCMWPQRVAMNVPSPVSDVVGNCVIFAVKPQCKSSWDWTNKKDVNNPNEVYSEIVEDVRDSGTCSLYQKWIQITEKWRRSSPFNLYEYSKPYEISLWGWINNWSEFSTSFLWIIELETDVFIAADDNSSDVQNSIIVWDIDVLGWKYNVNQIKWWIQQWIRKILIDKWLDPQIRYITNQLTKMHVNIKLPNISNLIWNEVEVLKNITENIWDILSDSNDNKNDIETSISSWSDLSYEKLNEYNQAMANPFESLASLMNQSNIINITTEPLTVKVPMIFAEDINAYHMYLEQWIDVNEDIMDQWKKILNSLWSSCAKKEKEEEKQQCYREMQAYLTSFVEFEKTDWQKMLNQIYSNIMILQEYRNFPFEMYEWVHVIDRYMSEIASLINNTIGYLSYWTSINSERFVWYVDAIVLMMNIIKTYQLIIDFSVEWSQNCWNCAKDTYDQYSCKLSLLCDGIQLPIIQIPNFKLPNITVDLTNIDLWLDIILPEFNFQPIRVDLPDLPNLPEPPSIWANIKLLDLPNILQLPEPPHLPELPSFIPEVELELPILPPAPELPKLPNQIESLIKVAKLIWKIYCIVKWDFGLVWESSVKAKIEQLTQRTYEVSWIDNIMNFTNWSAAPIKNYWVDYEISSYVDLQFNFSDIYNYLDILTKWINNLTTSSINFVQEKWNNLYNKAINPIVNIADSIDGANVNVNGTLLDMNNSDWDNWIIRTSMINNYEQNWLTSEEIEYVDYSSAKNRLNEVLAYIQKEYKDTTFSDKVDTSLNKIKNNVNTLNNVSPNINWINEVENQILGYLKVQNSKYNSIADMINKDYDKFLAFIDSWNYQWNTKSELNSWKMLSFNVQLFDVDPFTRYNLENLKSQNPYESLLNNKKDIIDGYRNAVNENTANDLWITKNQYLVLRENIWKMKNQLNWLYSVVKTASSTNLVAKNWINRFEKTLFATPGVSLSSNGTSNYVTADPSQYSEWIYERIIEWLDKGSLTKVIYSDSFVSSIKDGYRKTKNDMKHNILMWNSDSIYLKCFNQECSEKSSYFKWKYVQHIDKIPNKETWLIFDSDTKLKIADENLEVKNRKVTGQTYDILSLSWDLSDVDAYLIKLVERVDYSYEKSDYINKATPVHYVLALPDDISNDYLYENKVKLELLRKIDNIQNLSWKDLVEIVHYNKNKSSADVFVSNIDRKRYYSRIATLKFENNSYNINSPWSNQIVAWKQIAWDDQNPFWEASLFRNYTKETVSEWNDLEWYVWTHYTLNINWKDNVALSYINVSKNGKIIDEKYTTLQEDTVKVEWIFHTGRDVDVFKSVWIDQFGNKTEKVITVSYFVPDISITNIFEEKENVFISAELSQDIDEWNVSFQRKRWESWKTVSSKNVESDLSVKAWESIILWWPFDAWSDIAMYDKKNSVIALMNPDTAEINFQSGYANLYGIRVIVEDSAIIQVFDKKSNKSIFDISLPIKEMVKIEAENYDISDLSRSGRMWKFNGWKTVYKDWTNILLISPTGYLYSELWMEGEYLYDRELWAILLVLYQYSDLNKKNPIKIWLKVEPFETK